MDSLPLELLGLPNYTFCPDQISLLQFNIVALFFQQKDKKVFSLTFNNILLNLSLISSVAQSCQTLCDPMDCSTPGLPVHPQFPELAQTHVHQGSGTIQPSHPLLSPSPPTFNLSQHQGLFH